MSKSLVVVILFLVSSSNCDNCVDIKTRSNWGGQRAKLVDYQLVPVRNVIIHHTASSSCYSFSTCSHKLAYIQNYHMNSLKWNDIGYNFLIGNDGNIYEGAGWNKVGAHARNYNAKSIGIAFIGNFNKAFPNQEALDAAKKLLKCGEENEYLAKNYHLFAARQVIPTESPGLMLYSEIQKWDHWTARS